MIDAGKLRHRVTFQRYDGARDVYGAGMEADDAHWVDEVSVWAAVDPVSGRDFWEAEQRESEVTHKIRCRWRGGITPELRLTMGARRFTVVSVIDWEERHESLLIMAKELV